MNFLKISILGAAILLAATGAALADDAPAAPAPAAPAPAAPAPAAPAPAAAPAVASTGDVVAGETVFKKCKACHQIGETAKNAVGPNLNGIVGRKAGMIVGFNYSDANKNSGLTWDEATLKVYLHDPKAKVPGTKMTFAGLSSDADIDNVIAYLKQFGADGKKM